MNQFDISLSNLIVKKISNGRQTLFWNDTWLKDIGPLKFRFPRLYALEMYKNCIVAERWSRIDGIWQGNWAWRRHPTSRALSDLSSLNFLINGLVLDTSAEDKWTWALEDSGIFLPGHCAKPSIVNSLLARHILHLLGGILGCLSR